MNRKVKVVLGLGVVTFIAGTALSSAQDASGPDDHHGHAHGLPTCPVMSDESIDFNVSTNTEDGPVYFCCEGCIEKLEKNPDKYANKVAAQREALAKMAKIQVKCPVSGEAVDGKTTIDHNGEKVAFCCNDCVGKFESDPSKYKAKLAASYTYQTKCPVMGEDIDPSVSTTLATGETIYFCCKGCGKKMKANPSKYNAKLVAQGINIDWDKAMKKSGS